MTSEDYNEEKRKQIVVTSYNNKEKDDKEAQERADRELILEMRKRNKEEKVSDIKSILEANPKENYEKFFGKDGPFDRYANRNAGKEDIDNAKKANDDERKRNLRLKKEQNAAKAKRFFRRVAAGALSIATGLSLFGAAIAKDKKDEKVRLVNQSQEYISTLQDEIDEQNVTMEDYTKFEAFYENLKIVRTAEDKKSDEVLEAKLKIKKYVDSENLKKMTKTFIGKKMRDAIYYGDYEDSSKKDLKNEDIVRVTTREGDAENGGCKLRLHYGYSKTMVFNPKPVIDNVMNSNTIGSKELNSLVTNLYNLTVYNTEGKFDSTNLFKSDVDRCVDLAGKIFDDIARIHDKSFLLDKRGNIKEVTREKFEENVIEKYGKGELDKINEKREKNKNSKEEDYER